MFWINLHREHQQWVQHTEQALAWVDGSAPFLFETEPRVSGWSPAQHLYHLAIAHRPVLRWLTQQPDASATDADERPNVAGYLVLTLGRLPRGRGQSPSAFRPPDAVKRDDLIRRIEDHRQMLDALEGTLDELRPATGRLRHPALGHLDAGEWLRFGRIHTAHHHRIIRDIFDVWRDQ